MNELMNIFSTESYPWVYLALQQDENIKKIINNPSFIHFAAQKLGNNPQLWTPANLCLIILEIDPISEDLFREPLSDQLKNIINQGENLYEKLESSPDFSLLDLNELTILALAIAYDVINTNNLNKLFDLIGTREEGVFNQPNLLTIFAIVAGLIPQPTSLIVSLANDSLELPLTLQQRCVLLTHILFCTPLSTENQINQLKAIFPKASPAMQIELIKTIYLRRPNIAQALAEFFLMNNPFYSSLISEDDQPIEYGTSS